VRAGNMPPAGKPRPAPAELDAFNTWLDAAVFRAGCSGPGDPGRVTLRRLNRAEDNNTIRDLLGIDLRPAHDFPPHHVGYGFDNSGAVLAGPPVLAERYVEAAERVVERAFRSPEIRGRLLSPPAADVVPYGGRGLLPVRAEARKTLRLSAPPPDPAQQELDRA